MMNLMYEIEGRKGKGTSKSLVFVITTEHHFCTVVVLTLHKSFIFEHRNHDRLHPKSGYQRFRPNRKISFKSRFQLPREN